MEPVEPVPAFQVGGARPDTRRPRFGVSMEYQDGSITIDSACSSVLAAVVLSEIVGLYFPVAFRVDVVWDFINRFCGMFRRLDGLIRIMSNGRALQRIVCSSPQRRIPLEPSLRLLQLCIVICRRYNLSFQFLRTCAVLLSCPTVSTTFPFLCPWST